LTPATVEAGSLPFAVEVNGLRVAHDVFAVYLLPGDKIALRLDAPADRYAVTHQGRSAVAAAPLVELAVPTQTGLSLVRIEEIASGEAMTLNVFSMLAASAVVDGRIDGYTIGRYPSAPLNGNPAYLPPRGFVRVTEENAGTKVSPHFTIGQFTSKQSDAFPKYVWLRPELLLLLEIVLAELNAAGVSTDSFVVMSGYRTPSYNEAIANVPSSRHVYGDAADIYIDVHPADGVMDDLDGDGRSTHADAQWLAAFIERLFEAGKLAGLVGGLSAYAATPAHGPFVHVDTRGYRARW
jgi:hypothetical protein